MLFTDFVNFTGKSETLTDVELVDEIDRNVTAFDSTIENNGLKKIKTIGDAFMAVCGLPNEDHNMQSKQLGRLWKYGIM